MNDKKRNPITTIVVLVVSAVVVVLLAICVVSLIKSQSSPAKNLDNDLATLLEFRQDYYNETKQYGDVIAKYNETEEKYKQDPESIIAIIIDKVHFMSNAGSIGDALASLQDLEESYGDMMSSKQLYEMWNSFRYIYYEYDDAAKIEEYSKKIDSLTNKMNEE